MDYGETHHNNSKTLQECQHGEDVAFEIKNNVYLKMTRLVL